MREAGRPGTLTSRVAERLVVPEVGTVAHPLPGGATRCRYAGIERDSNASMAASEGSTGSLASRAW
jgi:hypothetical protein